MTTKIKPNAIILLSGGLDSLVSLELALQKYNIILALHFDYGQIPFLQEKNACVNICKYYNILLKIIKLEFLEEITQQSIQTTDNSNPLSYWVPNRNGLFINIGASYAESLDADFVIIGANAQEAVAFKDNSSDFIDRLNEVLKYSTQNELKVLAPLIKMNKAETIKKALELNTPLHLIWSCYQNGEKHCGICPSCKLLKQGLMDNLEYDLQKKLF